MYREYNIYDKEKVDKIFELCDYEARLEEEDYIKIISDENKKLYYFIDIYESQDCDLLYQRIPVVKEQYEILIKSDLITEDLKKQMINDELYEYYDDEDIVGIDASELLKKAFISRWYYK